MSILAVGSVAFDGIETPSGIRERCLGGAATYFALAASFFTQVRIVAVVGDDFTEAEESRLTRRGIDTRGIEHVPGKSFFWRGSYLADLNQAETLATELNVFENFAPSIPPAYADSEFLFLGNIDPVLQARVRAQLPSARMVCGDTMNYWIGAHRENLLKVLPELDALIINDVEAKSLADAPNLLQAAQKILALGPRSLIVKHGEYGATAFFSDQAFSPNPGPRAPETPPTPETKAATESNLATSSNLATESKPASKAATESKPTTESKPANNAAPESRSSAAAAHSPHPTPPFRAPALPLPQVVDPTGAGDSFAGGFYGYLASQPAITPLAYKTAMFYGGVMGSFAVERFGTDRLETLTREEIEARFAELRALSHLD